MASSPKDRMADIVKALYRKTADKEIQWERLSDDKEAPLRAIIGKNTVVISHYSYKRGGTSQKDIKLTIHDSAGNETDSIRDTQLDDDRLPPDEVSWWTLMLGLYNTASRQTLGSDIVLDELSEELGLTS